MSRLGVFVIHLDRAADRRAFMQRQLDAHGLDGVTWVRAVDWRAPDYAPRGGLSVGHDDVLIRHNWDGRIYVRGEDAIFQSHLAALRAFLESDCTRALIFEDDAELAPDFARVLRATLTHAAHWDVVSLEGFRTALWRPAVHVARLGDYDLVASLQPCAGSAAYLVTRAGAQGLLACADEVLEPFDNFLNAPWRHRLRLLDVAPFPARQGTFPSLRQEDHRRSRRTPARAFQDWRRHIQADFVGRYVRRWIQQIRRYGLARFTFARWSRDWSR